MSSPEDRSADQEELLICYVRAALAEREAGRAVDVRALCREHPELAPTVAESLGLQHRLPDLQRGALDFDPLAGKVLGGRYELTERLGTGAMGAVYRARDRELDRDVAVKLYEAILGRDPHGEARFLREAELLARLQHPHVVAVHDRGRSDEGLLFLVMDLLEGAPLSRVLAELDDSSPPDLGRLVELWSRGDAAPLPEQVLLRQIVRWAAEVAGGLQAAHERGVFHRDVKPSNIFILNDHRAVLLDFGIATITGEGAETLTLSVLGTPWYMAPEQATGQVRADASIDVYGLCATLYHLLTLRPPLEGDTAEVLSRLRTDDPVPVVALRPDVPRDLAAIVDKGMERDPRRRYPTAAALEQDLRAFLEYKSVTARPLTRVGRAWRRWRRRPARSVAVAATTLAVALAIGIVPLWQSSEAHAAARRRAELHAVLPARLAIEGQPDQRLLVPLDDHEDSFATLDELIALDPHDLPSRLWRAALWLDRGDHEAAARDLEAIAAARDGSPYLAAVATRYLAADPGRRGVESVDLEGLPEPVSPEDCFVAGFHELRNRHRPGFARRADALLERAAEHYLPARDLRLLSLIVIGESEGSRDHCLLAHDESLTLEGAYGRPTARTLSIRGATLLLLKRYDEAIGPLEASNRLRPNRHGPLINLGVAYRRQGRLDDALACLDRAIAIRPHLWNAHYTKAEVLKDEDRFDEALECAAALPDDNTGAVLWRRPELSAGIHVRRAIHHLENGRPDESRAAAARAVEAFSAALAGVPPHFRRRLQVRSELARALAAADFRASTAHLLNLLLGEPDNSYQLGNLASLLPPEGLDADTTFVLRLFLRRLSIALAGGDGAHAQRQRAQYAKDKQAKQARQEPAEDKKNGAGR